MSALNMSMFNVDIFIFLDIWAFVYLVYDHIYIISRSLILVEKKISCKPNQLSTYYTIQRSPSSYE